MIQLTYEGGLILSLNVFVVVVLALLSLASIRLLLKKPDDGHFAATVFAVVYVIFLVVQEFHLFSLMSTGTPLDGYVYSTLATSLQSFLPMSVIFVWGYYVFGTEKARKILGLIALGYILTITLTVTLLQPFVPVLDPITQLWDMNLQPPLTYFQYLALAASLIFAIHLLFQGFRVSEKALGTRYQAFGAGYLLYTLGIMFRFMGMDLIFTLTRKVLLCIGVYLMIASFIGFKLNGQASISD